MSGFRKLEGPFLEVVYRFVDMTPSGSRLLRIWSPDSRQSQEKSVCLARRVYVQKPVWLWQRMEGGELWGIGGESRDDQRPECRSKVV